MVELWFQVPLWIADLTKTGATAEQKAAFYAYQKPGCVEPKAQGEGWPDLGLSADFLELLSEACVQDEVCAAMVPGLTFKKPVFAENLADPTINL